MSLIRVNARRNNISLVHLAEVCISLFYAIYAFLCVAGFDTLLTRDITKSSAMQRAGRAGREGSGVCFRLYTEDAFNSMSISGEPEILRCSLTASILNLKTLGQNLEELDLMDKPDFETSTCIYPPL